MKKYIEINSSVIISKNIETVFNYFANLENDKFWRKEINFTTTTGKPEKGTEATESSYLSKRAPSHILNLICTDFKANSSIVYRTLPDSEFVLESNRKVEAISTDCTRVVYDLKFSKNIVKQGIGFNLPDFVIRLAAKSDMKKYLAKLKAILETN